uniref:Uncharacterized protein n=1 Tax=Bicosoecida sp. CB-2014 TaxID=1486930 RepID=A0A7S1G409_9STRA|mmetsp:Transcript_13107/g.45841  ORF Transcript_13107/g.45841 Transcript_13107/m.45841 type:complete len:292 (+) Transcript_13107:329-1204(+)
MATKKHSDPRVAMLAGAIAGGIEATVTWPSEFVKTQLQLQGRAGQPILYKGPIDCVKQTVRANGFIGLYRGLPALLVGSVPKAGIRFGAFNWFSSKLRDENGKMSAGRNFAAGMATGVIEAVTVVTPMETLKVKLINANKGFARGTADVIRVEGLGGIYKGLPATIGRQASNQGIRFFTFNEYKRVVMERTQSKTLHPMYALGGGMLAGVCSVLGNNPIDVIKTRTQGLEAHKYSSTWDCVTKTYRAEGALAFYKGALSRMARVVPGQGIVFASYETCQRFVAKALGLPDV